MSSSPPPAKRQRVDDAVDVFTSSSSNSTSVPLTIRDLSFQTPLRKKLNVIFTQNELQAHSPAKQELSIPLSKVQHVICVAAPDKTAKTWNFVVIDNESVDAWVFGVPDTPAKTAVADKSLGLDTSQSYKALLIEAFKRFCKVTVAEPSRSEFASPIPLPGRPKETAYHAIAHRGAKEGYLYFLSTGILYGFKKPIMFFPLSSIREVTFTNVLQRTFNLVVSTEENVEGEEFAMIDQVMFAGIQAYTEKHRIQDASMSEQWKAKKVGKQDAEESGQLDKAFREYEAEHDDDDEDFREFDKAEAEWEDDGGSKGKATAKLKGADINSRKGRSSADQTAVNGEAPDSSDDEELDATFEAGDSDEESAIGSSDDSSEEDSDDDDDDDEDDDEDDEGEDEDEEQEEEEDDKDE